MLENFRGLRKFARNRAVENAGLSRAKRAKCAKAPQPRPEVNLIFNLAIFAGFARDNPIPFGCGFAALFFVVSTYLFSIV
jgi:hypothetical protein